MPSMAYPCFMTTTVEHTDEFEDWWDTLAESEQEDIAAIVDLLTEQGARLRFP